MNGGIFYPHKTHDDGSTFDGRTAGFDQGNYTKKDASITPIKDHETSLPLIDMFKNEAFVRNLEELLVTFKAPNLIFYNPKDIELYVGQSNFIKSLESACLVDGRLAGDSRKDNPNGVVRFNKEHADHWHAVINLNRVSKVRSTIPGKFQSVRGENYGLLRFKIVTDDRKSTLGGNYLYENDVLDIKPISNKNYRVYGLAEKDLGEYKVGDWVQLEPVGENDFAFYKDGKEVVPLNQGQMLNYKLVYMGNKTVGCFSTDGEYALIHPRLEFTIENVAKEVTRDGIIFNVGNFSQIYVYIRDLYSVKETPTTMLSRYWDYYWDDDTESSIVLERTSTSSPVIMINNAKWTEPACLTIVTKLTNPVSGGTLTGAANACGM